MTDEIKALRRSIETQRLVSAVIFRMLIDILIIGNETDDERRTMLEGMKSAIEREVFSILAAENGADQSEINEARRAMDLIFLLLASK